MKKFIWANFALAGLIVFVLVIKITLWLPLFILYAFLGPAMMLLDLFSIENCVGGNGFGCGPTPPTTLLTFAFFVLIVTILTKLDKKRILDNPDQNPMQLSFKSIAALIILFNIGAATTLIVPLITSSLEKYNYRTTLFEQEIDQKQDFPLLGFSIKTPPDWTRGEYSGNQYAALIPKKLEERVERFSQLIISPSVSLVGSRHISTSLYEIGISRYRSKLCRGGGFQPSNFAGRASEECTLDNSYQYIKIIRIKDLSDLNSKWKADNLIWFSLPQDHKNLAPLYEKVLSTLKLQSVADTSNSADIKNDSPVFTEEKVSTVNSIGFLITPYSMPFHYQKSWSPDILSEKNFFNVSVSPIEKELNWTSKVSQDWIDVATSGSTMNGGKIDVGVSKNVAQLPVGEHAGTITFSVLNNGQVLSQTVQVTLFVEN